MTSFPIPSAATGATVRDRPLSAVRDVIPPSCYRRSTALGLVSVGSDLLIYVALLVGLAWVRAWWLDVPLVILAGLAVSSLFVLAHDASHQALFDSRRLNTALATILMLPSLHINEAWIVGHNRLHHGHTTRQGFDFVWHPLTAEQYAALRWWERARHRLEWSWAGSGAYYLREVWFNKMIRFTPTGSRGAAIRRGRLLVGTWALVCSCGALALGWAQGGPASAATMWLKLVVAPFLVFVEVIGWTVYVHHIGPDLHWWPRREWTPWKGQMESTTVLRIPRVFNLFLHNIFVHVPHHVDPRIPWYHLPAAAAAIDAAFPGKAVARRLRLRDYLRSTRRCKLYDWEAKAWSTYPVAPAPGASAEQPA